MVTATAVLIASTTASAAPPDPAAPSTTTTAPSETTAPPTTEPPHENGDVWFSDATSNHLARIDSDTDQVSYFPVIGADGTGGLALGDNHSLWATDRRTPYGVSQIFLPDASG